MALRPHIKPGFSFWFKAPAATGMVAAYCLVSSLGAARASQTADRQNRLIVVPDWAGQVQCRLGSADPIYASASAALALDCRSGDAISCDGPFVEPLDVDAGDLCDAGQLPVSHAEAFAIAPTLPGVPARATVQWIHVDSGVPAVVAQRNVEFVEPTALNVSPDERRFVRFLRTGASPLTVSAQDLRSRQSWVLPRAVMGGEVFLVPAAASVRPTAIQLLSIRPLAIPVQSEPTSVPGLPAGQYSATPIFDGGVRGHALPFRVQNGASTTLNIPAPAVGGVFVSLPATSCPIVGSLTLRSADGGRFRHRTPQIQACRWSAAGIPPGSYLANISTEFGSAGTARIVVQEQTFVSAEVATPLVTVDGRIWLNKSPMSAATVYAANTLGGIEQKATTDSLGQFILHLDTPGTFVFRTAQKDGAPVYSTIRRVLAAGQNRLDLELSAGTVSITLAGADPARPTQITLANQARTITRATSSGRIDIHGVPFGTYSVVASQSGDPYQVSLRPISVHIQDSNLTESAAVPIGVNSSQLRLHDEAGLPLSDSSVMAQPSVVLGRGRRAQAPEIAPGVYSLRQFPVGAPIYVLADNFVPACLQAPADKILDVTLSRGRSVTVEFSGPAFRAIMPTMGAVAGVPGSDCPVPLVQFATSALPSTAGRTRFRFESFPFSAGLSWIIDQVGFRQPIAISDDGTMVLRPPTQTQQGR